MTSAAQHPKKASVEAARNLHHSGVLPVSEELRAMSAHDPERHAPNTELIQAKAERFAILAHFIALVAEQSVDGQGEAAQFRPGYIKQTIQEAADTDRYIAKDAKMMILTNVLLDVDETIAQDIVLAEAQAPARQRYAELFRRITAHENSLDSEDAFRPSNDDPETDLLSRVSGLADLAFFIPNYLQIIDYFCLMNPEFGQMTAAEKRAFAHANIGVLTRHAGLNTAHAEKVEAKAEFGYGFTSYPGIRGFSVQKDDRGEWHLSFKSSEKKPTTGLMGATLGCPANYQINEGETALENYLHAGINFAFDEQVIS